MYACINGATTMPYTLEQDLAAAEKAGFEGVEIWSRKLHTYLESHSVDGLKELLDQHHLKVAALCPYSLIGFSDNRGSIIAIRNAAEIAKKINCPTLLVCGDAAPAGTDKEAAYDAMANIACTYADWAEEHGVKIAIEPLGRHPLIPGPKEAMEILDRAEHESLGLMMDTFHYYKSGVDLDTIRQIPVELLLVVHVNDCENRPLEELNDKHRVYMGEGVIPLKPILNILKEKGYDGALSVEIFRDEYWAQPVDVISAASKSSLDRLMAGL